MKAASKRINVKKKDVSLIKWLTISGQFHFHEPLFFNEVYEYTQISDLVSTQFD